MKYPPIMRQVPHIVHGGDYNPDQWLREKDVIWKEDMRLAKLAGLNSLSVGIFSWAALEPEEGVYDFAWLDEILDRMADNGLTAVLATPSGARPAWLSQKYPEVLRVNERREKMLHGGRHNHCLSSQVYRRKVQEINTLLAERYKDHPALGAWHISNEFGGECHCPACQENFRLWLREKYDTLDNLNHAWWTAFWSHTYTDWSQIESPSPIGEQSVHAQKLDWKRFTTDQFRKWYRIEIEPLKRITPDVPCTTNLMGTYPGINYFDLAKDLDFVCWDSYPQWESTENDIATAQFFSFEHDLTRGLKGGKPFFLMESCPSATNWRPYARLHRPGVHELQSMQAVGHGLHRDAAGAISDEPVQLCRGQLGVKWDVHKVQLGQQGAYLVQIGALAQQPGDQFKHRDVVLSVRFRLAGGVAHKVQPCNAQAFLVDSIVVERILLGHIGHTDHGVVGAHLPRPTERERVVARGDGHLIPVRKFIIQVAAKVQVFGPVGCCRTHKRWLPSYF